MYTSNRLFPTRLPTKLRRRVVLSQEVDPDDESTMNCEPVFDKTMKDLEAGNIWISLPKRLLKRTRWRDLPALFVDHRMTA